MKPISYGLTIGNRINDLLRRTLNENLLVKL